MKITSVCKTQKNQQSFGAVYAMVDNESPRCWVKKVGNRKPVVLEKRIMDEYLSLPKKARISLALSLSNAKIENIRTKTVYEGPVSGFTMVLSRKDAKKYIKAAYPKFPKKHNPEKISSLLKEFLTGIVELKGDFSIMCNDIQGKILMYC